MEKRCVWCGDQFEGEEIDSPMTYEGDKICDECYQEKQFSCILCEEMMDDQNITHLMINCDDIGVDNGYYEVVSRPFISADCLGINIAVIPSSVKKVKELTGRESEGADYLCPDCSKTIAQSKQEVKG